MSFVTNTKWTVNRLTHTNPSSEYTNAVIRMYQEEEEIWQRAELSRCVGRMVVGVQFS